MTTRRKKFNEEEGSIEHTLSNQPKKVRNRYKKNKARYYQDFWSLEVWASKGFTSGEEGD